MSSDNCSAVLVTGASGFLAGELLPRLVEKYPESTIYTLLRAENKSQLAERREAILNFVNVSPQAATRIVA
ncbi:MAG: hypothetical protein FD167_3411, partial [bacterium]